MESITSKTNLHILVANCTHKHVTFNKGQCTGYVEASPDHMPQTIINSQTTQWMFDEHIQPDTFTHPLHALPDDVKKSLNQLLEIFK